MAVLALTRSGAAHETDQFTLPHGRAFADIGPQLNVWAFRAIQAGVDRTNGKIERCVKEKRSAQALAALQSADEIVRAVNSEFPNAYDVIEGLEKKADLGNLRREIPGALIGFEEPFKNIFQHVHFPLDPRQLFRIWHASTFKVYGTYLGSDKIGHFTDMGMHYYKAYASAREEGRSEREALAAAVRVGTHGAIFSERGMVGYLSAGAYSNADLVANYLGLLFYRNLTESVNLEGELRPPMLVRDGLYWRTAPHVTKDSDFFAVFICDHLNEALNPSHFEDGMREEIRRAIKARTDIILARYADNHGNRLPKAHFDELLKTCQTYYGQDYGYRGPRGEIIGIGLACFETFKPDARVTARDVCGNTPLHVAAGAGNLQSVRQLVSDGADVNAQVLSNERYSAEWGNRPLHYAARDGQKEVAAILIDSGATINAANDRGQTALHRALAHPEVALYLIERAADVNVADARGQTPLHWASGDGHLESVRHLLSHGARIDSIDNNSQTPLHAAARSGHSQIVSELLGAGAKASAAATLGVTPLHLAARHGHSEVVELLLRAGADPKCADEFGWTPLHDAAESGSDQALAALLTAGSDPKMRDAHGSTALHMAARKNRHGAVVLLLSNGADRDAANASGATPLHEATRAGHAAVVAALLEHGADGRMKTRKGLTALDIAVAKKNSQIATMLRNVYAQQATIGAVK